MGGLLANESPAAGYQTNHAARETSKQDRPRLRGSCGRECHARGGIELASQATILLRG
jgi:hypothetical protein